jgi:two-component system response regulator PilR (NtrC family)
MIRFYLGRPVWHLEFAFIKVLVVARILVVDDELSMRQFLEILLKKEGHEVFCASDGEEALAGFQAGPWDLLVSDIKMPKMGGLDLLRKAKGLHPNIAVIMITAYASPEDAIAAMKAGAYDYLTKPFKVEEIKAVIRNALAKTTGPPGFLTILSAIAPRCSRFII